MGNQVKRWSHNWIQRMNERRIDMEKKKKKKEKTFHRFNLSGHG